MTTFEEILDEIRSIKTGKRFKPMTDYEIGLQYEQTVELYAKKHAIEFAQWLVSSPQSGSMEQLYERFLKEGK